MSGAVERFFFVRLAAGDAASRADVAARLRAAFESALGVVAVSAGVPADDSAAKWDLSLVVRCVDLAAWDAVAISAPVVAALDALAAQAVVVKSWTFAVLD